MEETERSGVCLRCGAPYEPEATVCLKCGAPIGETQVNTQPVRAVKVPDTARSTSIPAQPSPTSVTTSLLTASAPLQRSSSVPEASAPRRRRGWLIPVALAVVVLLALGTTAYVVRGLTAPAPVATQTVYRDPQHRFHFIHPTLWAITPQSDGVTLTDSDGVSTAQIMLSQPTLADTTAKTYADQLATHDNLSPTTPQSIAGATWERRLGQVTGSDGAVREEVIMVTLRDGQFFIIQLSCPISSYDQINAQVYQPLLTSFQFG